MATAISKANFENACGECYDAILASNWSQAYIHYAAAEAQLSGLEIAAGGGGVNYRLRESLDKLGKAIDVAKAGSNASAGESRLVTVKTRNTR